ncbi:MAG: NAD(+) kinase [Gammaproteobacteria bacterium]
MNSTFERIGLISKSSGPALGETLQRLIAFLTARGLAITLDASAAEQVPDSGLTCVERPQLAAHCDLVIVVGGDGTLLNAGRSLAEPGIPLVGVNLGRLGFLADVSPDRMTEELGQILSGAYEQEERTLLQASVYRGDQIISASDALNDVVVHKWDIARMIELEVHIDGRTLNTQRSDGLIVATPTGSTAYALSGGGPILHPSLDAMVLVPICPHSLSNRPIVINETSRVDVLVHAGAYTQAQVTCDGQVNFALLPGDRVHIRRKPQTLKLIHPPGYDYFGILRRKFDWGKSS